MEIFPIVRGEERTIGWDFADLITMYLNKFQVAVTVTPTSPELRMYRILTDGSVDQSQDYASAMFVSTTPTITGTRATAKTKVPTAAAVPEGQYKLEWEVQLSNTDRPIGKDAAGVRPELHLTG